MKAIEYQSVTKKYSGSSGYSVDNVSTTIDEGEFVTILGSSGCGKSCAGAWDMSSSRSACSRI